MTPIDLALEECGFPKRHIQKFISKQCVWSDESDVVRRKFASLPKGFLAGLCGPRGVGKTQLATSIGAEFLSHSKSSRYITAMDFFVEIKSTFGRRNEQTQNEVILESSRPTFLVIDEFDKRAETEWENGLIFYLVDRRYRSMKSTLLISNLSASAFGESLGDSVSSRMNECGGVIECNWPSFREK